MMKTKERDRLLVQNEGLFSNGPPHWREGKNDRPCETSRHAIAKRQKLVELLRRHHNKHPGAKFVADALDACAPGARCSSGACPECRRATQRLFVSRGLVAIERLHPSVKKWVAVTIIPTDASPSSEEILPASIKDARRRIRDAFATAGLQTFIGGIDICSVEFDVRNLSPEQQGLWPARSYRCAHGYFLVPEQEWLLAEPILRALFPRSLTVPRPIWAEDWDEDPRCVAYAMKAAFGRRIVTPAYFDDEGKKVGRNTLIRPDLRVRHAVKLAIRLHRFGLTARWMRRGVFQTGTAHGSNGLPEAN